MTSRATYEKNILSLLGPDYGKAFIDFFNDCNPDQDTEFCEKVQNCETITTLENDPSNDEILIYKGEDGIASNVSLNKQDPKNLNFDKSKKIITLELSNGKKLEIDLNPLFETVDTNTIDLDYTSNIVSATVIVDPNEDNLLEVTPNGLYVDRRVAEGDTNFAINDLTATNNRNHDFLTFNLNITSEGETTHDFKRFNTRATRNDHLDFVTAPIFTIIPGRHHYILADASSNDIVVALPSGAEVVKGDYYRVKAINLTNGVQVVGNGSEIINSDGETVASFFFTHVDNAYDFVYDGTEWRIF
jgi:hypothetical protein